MLFYSDVTDPEHPVVLGFMPTTTVPSSWRDMKIYKNYVYVGAESVNHGRALPPLSWTQLIVLLCLRAGMQCFDLTQLTTVSNAYRSSKDAAVTRNVTAEGHVRLNNVFEPTILYTEFGSSHNIVVNEETGFLYAVGTKTCRGGLHIADVRDPADPQFVGCYDEDGYTHDGMPVSSPAEVKFMLISGCFL